MTLVSAESARILDQFDLELANQVASRAALAIEHARLYSERSSVARTLQQNLLPPQLPAIPGYELASVYLPAIESRLVGGDFYDVWALETSWMMVIGDVTGKGIEAAALTALVRDTLRAASEFDSSPAHLLSFVDRTLKKRSRLSVCTALCLRLEGDGLTLAVGGHPLPLVVSADGIEAVGEYGPLLGAFAGASWQDHHLELKAGSTLVAYTDGVTDARGDDDARFGARRLCEALEELSDRAAAEMIDGLIRKLEAFQGRAQADDTAALALRRLHDRERVAKRQDSHEVLNRGPIAAAA